MCLLKKHKIYINMYILILYCRCTNLILSVFSNWPHGVMIVMHIFCLCAYSKVCYYPFGNSADTFSQYPTLTAKRAQWKAKLNKMNPKFIKREPNETQHKCKMRKRGPREL